VAIIDTQQLHSNGEGTLAGRVALVTGGTRGIGAAISRSLAGQGAAVAAAYGSNRGRAEELQGDLARSGVAISIHEGDVGLADDCRRTVRDVLDLYGRLDIVVNNAGITADKTVFKMADEDWYKVLERGSGRIVNISSIIGQTGNVGQTNYAASKSGVFGLTMSLAREAAFALKRAGRLVPDGPGITVNAVAPGFIETEMLDAVPEKALDRIRAQVPVDRLGRADEVARVVRFLAEDASAYITGQMWAVNGGMEM
jgi:acetoacetyl-CoA reductase/3-oxoacyl-[acyl-carrier protein] reductase